MARAIPALSQVYFGARLAEPSWVSAGRAIMTAIYDRRFGPRYRRYEAYGNDRGYGPYRTRAIAMPYGVRRRGPGPSFLPLKLRAPRLYVDCGKYLLLSRIPDSPYGN
jgi:hypothetical protein